MKLSFVKYLVIKIICLFFIIPAYAQENLKIDAQMKQAIEDITLTIIPGLSVAIATSDGLIWSGASGYSNIEDRQFVSQNHSFAIGNISNSFVAVVILQMAEEKMLNLNSTPQAILGDMVKDIENADSATLYELLNHTSGIYSWTNDEDWTRRARGVQMNPKYKWSKTESFKYITRDRHMATNAPGGAYAYSSSNYALLGLIAEKVGGGLIEDEVRKRILEPLKLNNTYYDGFEIIPVGRRVGSYHLATNQFISIVGINAKFPFGTDDLINSSGASLSSEGIASGMVSTPRDIALFGVALRKGLLINETSLSHIKTPFIEGIHSGVLGFTSDIRWLTQGDLVLVSFANLGTLGGGRSEASDYLNTYVEKIILPIAKKYAK